MLREDIPGLAMAAPMDERARTVQTQIREMNGRAESAILGTSLWAPAAKAGLANGVAGHAVE